jgi:hypothetical protein
MGTGVGVKEIPRMASTAYVHLPRARNFKFEISNVRFEIPD